MKKLLLLISVFALTSCEYAEKSWNEFVSSGDKDSIIIHEDSLDLDTIKVDSLSFEPKDSIELLMENDTVEITEEELRLLNLEN